MRAIVSLYRFVIAAFFLFSIIGIAFVAGVGISTWHQNSLFGYGFGLLSFIWAFVALVSLILAIGVTATFISLHDRMCELVEIHREREIHFNRSGTM